MGALLFGAFVALMLLNIPIAVALGLASMVALFFGPMATPPLLVVQRMFTAVDSFPFMAIPFFMLAGGLMEGGGISKRLVNFSKTLVGPVPGGLGIITIVSSAFFGAISGSNPATVASIGGIMIPAMIKAGYPKPYAAAIAAAAGTLGVIIPPSIPMVTYGVVSGCSIGDLFIAGLIPGIAIALLLTLVVLVQARRLGLRGDRRYSWREIGAAARDAAWALLMPIIVLGGIYGGVFTPTEAAAVAVVYSLIVGLFVYREFTIKDLPKTLVKAGISTSVVLFVIAASSSFSWLITSARIADTVTRGMMAISSSPFVLIFLINVLLLFLGTFLETQAIILLVAPILIPLAARIGLDPLALGIIMVVNTSVGMITPPMAVNLFVACGVADLKIEEISKPILPLLAVEIAFCLFMSNFPQMLTWLPRLIHGF
ncbi:MAG TPA: C4-dicarboxylate ABC transporter permease [Firmicutes bacterium]|jgi:C4-dicarboxylate transporter DctM subunit|nr:C4-dicarboxylate ABC transporter permease [Bacillota bacterium]HBK61814.1 C4-dicarboxylate ABC transporter permease [Bacillota bacterium]